MSASESGATITHSTGEPDVDGRSVGAKGAASAGFPAGREGPDGSARAGAEGQARTRRRLEATRAQDGKTQERKKVTAYDTGCDQDRGNPMMIACRSDVFNSAKWGWDRSYTAQSTS